MKHTSLYIWNISLAGLFAGAALIVLLILIPFWETLPVTEMMSWFRNFGGRIGFVMLPMEVIPLILSACSYMTARKHNLAGKNLWLAALICNIIILLMLFIYFIPVNLSFIHSTISADKVPDEMCRWKIIHFIRTLFILLSLVLGIRAFSAGVKNIGL